jgi:uncharacterized protein YjiS (DUF1127 family)
MLYREPLPRTRFSFRRLALSLAAAVEAGRHRRRTALDLRSMSEHLKRDLGLID